MSKFNELAKAKIQENKNVVVSIDTEDRVSIAQQLVVNDNGVIQNIFLKNAITTDINGLRNIKDAIDSALEKLLN